MSSQGRHEVEVRRSPHTVCGAHVAGERLRHCAVQYSPFVSERFGGLDADAVASPLASAEAACGSCSSCTRSSSLSVRLCCFKRQRMRSAYCKSLEVCLCSIRAACSAFNFTMRAAGDSGEAVISSDLLRLSAASAAAQEGRACFAGVPSRSRSHAGERVRAAAPPSSPKALSPSSMAESRANPKR